MKIFELLIESRVDFLRDKYIELIWDNYFNFLIEQGMYVDEEKIKKYKSNKGAIRTFEELWNSFVEIDPSLNKKYLQWLLNKGLELRYPILNAMLMEDAYKWKEYLTIYDKIKQRLPLEQRDINKLSLDQLKNIALQYKEKEDEVLTKNDYLDKKYMNKIKKP